jgi:hypothetical protein
MRHFRSTIVLSLFIAGHALGLSYLGTPTASLQSGQWAVGVDYGYSSQNLRGDGVNLNDTKWQTGLATVDVGLDANRAEIFGRVGVADAEWEGADWDFTPAVGFGGRVTTNLNETLSWGVAGQVLWWQDQDSRTSLYDIQGAFGPCWRQGKVQLYGGPMLHFVTSNFDIKETSSVGAYIGGGYDLAPSWTVSAEGQWTPDAHGLAIGLQRRF